MLTSKWMLGVVTMLSLIVGCDLEDGKAPPERTRSGFVHLAFSSPAGPFNGGDTTYSVFGIVTATDSTDSLIAAPRGLMFRRFIQVTDSNGVHTFFYYLPNNNRIRLGRGAGVIVWYRERATTPVQANLAIRADNGQLVAMLGNLNPGILQQEQQRAGVGEFQLEKAANSTILRMNGCGWEGDFDMQFSGTAGIVPVAPATALAVSNDGVFYEIANVCNTHVLTGGCDENVTEQIYTILRQ